MKIIHPLEGSENKNWIWWLLGISFSILFVVMLIIPLDPSIITFEFDALRVIHDWETSEKLWASFSLGLDFLYLVVYSNLFALGCIWSARQYQRSSLVSLGLALAWGQWIAAFLDTIEDIALLAILFGSKNQSHAWLAMLFAKFKFILIGLGLSYVVLTWIVKKLLKSLS